MKKSTGLSYRKRLTQVIEFMYAHIDSGLDVNRLAEVAMMSPYHFHRIYREMARETVNATVRRMRLERAAAELIRSDLPIAKIARQVAYRNIESFSRAFTRQFGESPESYRQSRRRDDLSVCPFVAMLAEPIEETATMYQVEINELTPSKLIGYAHHGDYMNIGQAFERIFHFAASHALIREDTRSVGLYYHDPESVEESELRSYACISVNDDVDLSESDSPEALVLPEGKCASLVFKGSYAELHRAYTWLFGQWLPNSGYEAADFPAFEEYLNDPKTTPPSELLTRVNCMLA